MIFRQKCSSCHTIGGGKLVGPDLQGISSQREPAWLRDFIADPNAMFAAGDPLALQLLKENNDLRMPNMGLSAAQVAAVLAYLAEADGATQLEGPAAALPHGEALAGQKLFNGETRLANGGMACIACHTVGGTGFLEGGSLGPDLTHAIQRYGTAGLASNLNQITFPTMQGPFFNRLITPDEQADLVAFFQWSDTQAPAPAADPGYTLLGIGTGGALLLFGILAFFWPRQRESLAARLRKNHTRQTGRPANRGELQR